VKRAWLFARCDVIGLALDDVPGVRAMEHEWPHTQTCCLWSFVVPRAQIVQVGSAPRAPEWPRFPGASRCAAHRGRKGLALNNTSGPTGKQFLNDIIAWLRRDHSGL
jgi:hypothetical protein